MAWQVEYTDEFLEWWDTLTEGEQVDVNAVVILPALTHNPRTDACPGWPRVDLLLHVDAEAF